MVWWVSGSSIESVCKPNRALDGADCCLDWKTAPFFFFVRSQLTPVTIFSLYSTSWMLEQLSLWQRVNCSLLTTTEYPHVDATQHMWMHLWHWPRKTSNLMNEQWVRTTFLFGTALLHAKQFFIFLRSVTPNDGWRVFVEWKCMHVAVCTR